MEQPKTPRMTRDEYHRWAEQQPGRYERVDGEVVAMAPERAGHARLKHRMARLLEDAVSARGLSCEVWPDGVTVRVDEDTDYEPDAAVTCGEPVPDDAVAVTDPVIVVEVASKSTHRVDSGMKLEGYFRVPSIRHYLIVRTERPAVIHHRRGNGGDILTRVVQGGVIDLDPPGIVLDVDALYRR